MNALLTLLLLASPGELAHYDNFVQNPSFEEDQDRSGSPDGWKAMAFDSPAQLVWDASVAHTGRHSVKISDSFRPGDQSDWKKCTGRWVSANYAIDPGTEYTLEVWVKTEKLTGQAYAHLAWQQDSRWLSEVPTPRLTGTNDWQKLSVSAVAPAGANTLVVSMNLARSEGTAWFDDVKVSGKSQLAPHVEFVFNDTEGWFPFSFPLDDTNLDSIDLTSLLDAPAGKHGFVTVGDDGHFHFDDGARARFFGTNVGGGACAPEKQDAPTIAARLAKYGVNMLRLHSMDSLYGPVIDYSQPTSQQLDAEGLDRIDFFVSELKKRGIYVYMDLLDYRQFRTADGVREGDQFTHNWQGSMKGASCFDERMIELQKDYATKLLTHRNPYTGLRYVDEPAVAVVETTNENSVFYFFRMNGLSRPYYREALTARWNAWLARRYGNRQRLAEAWKDADGQSALKPDEDPAQKSVALPFGMLGRLDRVLEGKLDEPLLAPARVSDMLRFFAELQDHYYRTMHGHLKQIGVRVPIAGTNQTFFASDTSTDARLNDFMSRNQYWRHPAVHAEPLFRFNNEPMLAVDLPTQRNPFSVIASTSVAGKPQAVAEFNFPWPNEYRAEGLLMAAAYASLQDWDIFLLFSYDPTDPRLSFFRSQSDPARWGEFPAAAAMFHRHDVSAARNEVDVVTSKDAIFEPEPDTVHAEYTEFRFLTFLSKVRNVFCDGPCQTDVDVALATGSSADTAIGPSTKAIRFAEMPWRQWLFPAFVRAAQKLGLPGYAAMDPDARCFDSDTGELSLDYGQGWFTIDTPRTKSAVGKLAAAGPIDLNGLAITCHTDWATVTATSLDGRPIGQSRRVLLTSVGRAENTNQGFWPPSPEQAAKNPMSWMLPGEGRLPVIAQPIEAEIRLNVPGTATAYPLDPTGHRLEPIKASTQAGVVRLNPAAAESIWVEVVVE